MKENKRESERGERKEEREGERVSKGGDDRRETQ